MANAAQDKRGNIRGEAMIFLPGQMGILLLKARKYKLLGIFRGYR